MSTNRSARRALRRSGAGTALVAEVNRLRQHNAALSLFLRGVIRAQGGLRADAKLFVPRVYLEGARDRVEAMPYEDGVVLTLAPDPAADAAGAGSSPLDDVPWGLDTAAPMP